MTNLRYYELTKQGVIALLDEHPFISHYEPGDTKDSLFEVMLNIFKEALKLLSHVFIGSI